MASTAAKLRVLPGSLQHTRSQASYKVRTVQRAGALLNQCSNVQGRLSSCQVATVFGCGKSAPSWIRTEAGPSNGTRSVRGGVRALAGSNGMDENLNVLVIGGGGREHAICWALRRSPSVKHVFCAPGNPGMSQADDAECISKLKVSDSQAVINFCQDKKVDLVVVGPEAPLVAGLVDDLENARIPAFGPSAEAAALEGSKAFMKDLCAKYNIPTAAYGVFTDAEKAKEFIHKQKRPPVVKADGLAAGKGVIVAATHEEACKAVEEMLHDKRFGAAGGQVVVEEFLVGEEASFFALVDGQHALPLVSAQDHKRAYDNDEGPNTGGMGAYTPAPVVTPEIAQEVMDTIILPTVQGMAKEGCPFVGVLYAGLMIDPATKKPKLLEYNVRFGDPECQPLMMRLESDLAQVLLAATRRQLRTVKLSWNPDPAVCIVLASKGYPGSFTPGTLIKNLENASEAVQGVKIFHAGTSLNDKGEIVATGGRVLGVTATGKDVKEARDKAYKVVGMVDWPEGFCRRDIAWRALQRETTGATR